MQHDRRVCPALYLLLVYFGGAKSSELCGSGFQVSYVPSYLIHFTPIIKFNSTLTLHLILFLLSIEFLE
ncbi:hypothetical protein RIF29_13001 [Crotalaria pallida]|uniref:Secreted protein n=1 Tax=Crotalaria pallida TaxID=3830 RepID=A0AAN9IP23_CROPI